MLLHQQFGDSKRFTRGWTLQELIAPREVLFLSRDWRILGSKRWSPKGDAVSGWEGIDLGMKISGITGIPTEVLQSPSQRFAFSVAQRMSWATRRETSRSEDIAYCLLGIFGINMPLLYGERGNAFYRLQKEIATAYDDETIFAWKSQGQAEYSMEG